jgi:hypothetical protein
MGEFHAEDYKIEEARPSSNKSANRFDNGFDGKSQKDDNSRSNGGRPSGSRKAFNSDEVCLTHSTASIYFSETAS